MLISQSRPGAKVGAGVWVCADNCRNMPSREVKASFIPGQTKLAKLLGRSRCPGRAYFRGIV